ncbi:TnsA-like heteromeric transposase endonuclease subunit [Nocardia sp. NPDC004123]
MGVVVAVAGGDDCWVEFVDPGAGGRCKLPLLACAAIRFERVEPARRILSFRGQKNFSGSWWSATTGSHIGYESWVERDWLMSFDSSPQVSGIGSQPFRLSWPAKQHVPDYFLRLCDGGAIVVDVRPDSRIDADDQATFDQTAALCDSVRWQYRRLGDMSPVHAANLRWLSGYRHPRCRRAGLVAQFSEVFSAARPLAEGVGEVGDPIVVLPTLFHLLWCQDLAVDLKTARLGPGTIIGGERR